MLRQKPVFLQPQRNKLTGAPKARPGERRVRCAAVSATHCVTKQHVQPYDCARGQCDNRSDRRLQTQTNLTAAAKADERMWRKRAVSIVARASITAPRSDIELQSVLRYCLVNFALSKRGSPYR